MKAMTPLQELRHSTAHIMATAVLRLFPETKLDIGPPTDTGFYYDFDLDHKVTPDDLVKIEAEMKKVSKENQPFERIETSRDEAKLIIAEIGQGRYKLGRLDDIPEGEAISFYRNGEFIDLCAGTHVRYTRKVKAFKLLNIAGAYHRGNEKNQQLQRIYGTAFATKSALDEHLQRLEEAKRRDHRRIGRDIDLFHLDEAVGPGLVLWKPKGAVIRQELQTFIAEELRKGGYEQVFTPHICKLELFRTSGHYPYYQDSQYPPLVERNQIEDLARKGCSCAELANRLQSGDIDGYLLKPMNCPFHIKIFESRPHSYRDLPIRLAEFGTVYRYEQSGELTGMARVRGLTQDDAHLFCMEEQLDDELHGCLELVRIIFDTLGMKDYRVRVGLRDPDSDKFIRAPQLWEKAEDAIRRAAQALDDSFVEEPGEAAFYGPKIDFVVRDVIGREWQLGTVQVDFVLPERFDLSYIGKDNQPHRPVMIHRAPFGSMERFVGLLIEHFAGNFPTWLAPEQVRILPITDAQQEFSEILVDHLRGAAIRATADLQPDKLGAKIRRAEMGKVAYMLVVGAREAESGKVSVRSRVNPNVKGTRSIEEFLAHIQDEIAHRILPSRTP